MVQIFERAPNEWILVRGLKVRDGGCISAATVHDESSLYTFADCWTPERTWAADAADGIPFPTLGAAKSYLSDHVRSMESSY